MTDRDFKLRIRLEAVKDWAKCGIHHNHAHNEQKLEYNLQVLDAVVKAVDDLDQKAVELDRLHSEIREFRLLVREYFHQRTRYEFAKDRLTLNQSAAKATDLEKKILKELERFTAKEQEELPFKD